MDRKQLIKQLKRLKSTNMVLVCVDDICMPVTKVEEKLGYTIIHARNVETKRSK